MRTDVRNGDPGRGVLLDVLKRPVNDVDARIFGESGVSCDEPPEAAMPKTQEQPKPVEAKPAAPAKFSELPVVMPSKIKITASIGSMPALVIIGIAIEPIMIIAPSPLMPRKINAVATIA